MLRLQYHEMGHVSDRGDVGDMGGIRWQGTCIRSTIAPRHLAHQWGEQVFEGVVQPCTEGMCNV